MTRLSSGHMSWLVPEFRNRIHFIRIRIQHFWLNTDPDPGFWYATIYLALGLHKWPSYRRSRQLSKENIQHFQHKVLNFFYFCVSFLPSWIRIPNMDPDPLARKNQDPIRIRNSAAPPPYLPLFSSVSSTVDAQEDWERETTYWRERGGKGVIIILYSLGGRPVLSPLYIFVSCTLYRVR